MLPIELESKREGACDRGDSVRHTNSNTRHCLTETTTIPGVRLRSPQSLCCLPPGRVRDICCVLSLFEFANPQLDGGGDFPCRRRAGLLQAIDFLFFSITTFDDFDLVIHNAYPITEQQQN